MITTKLTEAIKIAAKYPTITRVGVFGSYSRNEESENSDIDILFDYSDITNEIDEYTEELKNIITDRKIDFVTLNGLLKSDNKKIRESILNDVIWIYEKWA